MKKFKLSRPVLAVLIVGLFAGCAVTTPQPETSEIAAQAPSQFQTQAVLSGLASLQEAGLASAKWWEGFNDPLLSGLVDRALGNNPGLLAAAAQVRQAKASLALSQAQDDLLLELEAAASVRETNRSGENRPSFTGDGNSNAQRGANLGLAITLPVDLAGRFANEQAAAAANLMNFQAQLRARMVDVSTQVVQAYLRLRGNQRQLELLAETLALQEQTLAVVQARFEAGLSPELDVRRAETSLANLKAQEAPLQQALQDAIDRLGVLTGRYPGGLNAALGPVAPLPEYQLGIPSVLPLQVLQARPDVQASQARLLQTYAQLGVARANLLPSFQLMASLQIGRTAVSGDPVSSVVVSSLAAMLNQVLLDGGARDAQVDIAKAQADQALALYDEALLLAIADVESVLNAVQFSNSRQKALGQASESSLKSFEQAQALYQLGLISFLDVVDAQRVYADSQQALAAEQTNYAIQIAGLFRALGLQTQRD